MRTRTMASIAAFLLALFVARSTNAQLAPTGDHYAARTADTGFGGTVGSSGGYSTAVPLVFPEARGGLPVPLSVVYGGHGVGAAGLGWDIPLSYVRVDTTFAHHRPVYLPNATPSSQQRVTLSLAGATLDVVPHGSSWVARSGTLEDTLSFVNGVWTLYDGNGLTYKFQQPASLAGTGLYLLVSISGRGGSIVQLIYEVGTVQVNGGSALTIDLSSVSYNSHPNAPCFKDFLQILYYTNSPTPLSLVTVGSKTIARMHTLGNIYVRRRADCSSDKIIFRSYTFTYAPDPDTALPRLASVTVSARQDSGDRSVMPVANYTYGAATQVSPIDNSNTGPPVKHLQYALLPNPIALPEAAIADNVASTVFVGSLPSGLSGFPTTMTQLMTDITGDGRPDYLFTDSGVLKFALGIPGSAGSSQFDGPRTLENTDFLGGPIELGSSSISVRSQGDLSQPYTIDRQWRMLIDMNGDGRLDVLDAAEEPDAWVVYLNTPDPTSSNPIWQRRTIDISAVRAALQNLFPIDIGDLAHHIPLSNRKTSPVGKAYAYCARWNGTEWHNFPDGWATGNCQPLNDGIQADHWLPVGTTEPEASYTEWEIRDINGDGYPDLVFSERPAEQFVDQPQPGQGEEIQTVTTAYSFHLTGTNRIDALLNVAGLRLAEASQVFSAPVGLSDDPYSCGVEKWESVTTTTQRLACGLADVNGDGLIDRVEDTSAAPGTTVARLGTGTYPASPGMDVSTFSIALPGPLSTQKNTKYTDCPAMMGVDPITQAALRDITGDGIPDYITTPDGDGAGWTVSIGTGSGFLDPIPIKGPFELSRENEDCQGLQSITHAGLYDMDGDGKADYVNISHWMLTEAQIVDASGTLKAPASGKLVTIDNGYGAVTTITYRSAKDDGTTPHWVPEPEIVVTSVETKGTRGLGGSTAAKQYAYGNARTYFDPAHDTFRSQGYAKRVELRVTSAPGDPNVTSMASITDTLPLAPFSANPAVEFDRYAQVGQVKDVTVLSGSLGSDPWALLTVNSDSDLRRIARTDYTHASVIMPEPPLNLPIRECVDYADPYSYDPNWPGASSGDPCTVHGFSFLQLTDSWRGASAPPDVENVQTHSEVTAIDNYGRATGTKIDNQLPDPQGTNALCADVTYPNVGTTVPRVLTRPTARSVHDCANPQTVFSAETFTYDPIPGCTSCLGLVTSHTIKRFPSTGAAASLDDIPEFVATYDSAGNLRSRTRTREDGATLTSTFDYDLFGLAIVHERSAATGLPALDVSTTLDPVSLLPLTMTDANGTQRGAQYDGFGRPIQTTLTPPGGATGVLSTIAYFGYTNTSPSSVGRYISTTQFTDPVPPANVHGAPGHVGTTFLDELGRERQTQILLGSDYPDSAMISGARTYDSLGRIFFEADPYPLSQDATTAYGTTYYYSTDGTLALTVRGNGPQPNTQTSDATLERFPTVYRHAFDNHHELRSVEKADALTPGSAQEGVFVQDVLDGRGLPISRITWQGITRLDDESFDYDRLGQLVAITRYGDPNGVALPVKTSWTLDNLGQVLSLSEPGSPTQSRTYSRFGELLATEWSPAAPELDHAIVNQYDARSRLIHTAESNGDAPDPDTVRDVTYDGAAPISPQVTPQFLLGRMASAHAPTGDVYLSYDALGRTAARTFTDPEGVAYVEKESFHANGSLATVELDLPDTGYLPERVAYSYDSAGRTRSVVYTDPTGSRQLFQASEIDPFGRVRSATVGGTQVTASFADGGRRLFEEALITSPHGARRFGHFGNIVTSQPGPYDALGRELTRSENQDGTDFGIGTTSTYDALGRLISSVKRNGGTAVANRTFGYDPLGNITSLRDQMGPLGVLLLNSLTDRDRVCNVIFGNNLPPIPPGVCNVAYDAMGNVTSEPSRNGTRTLTFFNSGAVKSIEDASGASADFRYGAFGELQELDVTGGTSPDTRRDRHYGTSITKRDEMSGGTLTSELARDFAGPGFVASRRGPDGPWVFAFGEGRGVRFTTDENGVFLQDLDYQPYGEAVSTGAQPGTAQYSSEQWNGGDALASFGVVNLGARIYDPVIGRFLSRDPVVVPRTAARMNPYAFALNDPVNASDPTGLDPSQPCAGPSLCVYSGPDDPSLSNLGGAIVGGAEALLAGAEFIINGDDHGPGEAFANQFFKRQIDAGLQETLQAAQGAEREILLAKASDWQPPGNPLALAGEFVGGLAYHTVTDPFVSTYDTAADIVEMGQRIRDVVINGDEIGMDEVWQRYQTFNRHYNAMTSSVSTSVLPIGAAGKVAREAELTEEAVVAMKGGSGGSQLVILGHGADVEGREIFTLQRELADLGVRSDAAPQLNMWLDARGESFSPAANMAWIQEAVDREASFLSVSDITLDNLRKLPTSRFPDSPATVFGQELFLIRSQGYTAIPLQNGWWFFTRP